MSVNIIEGEKKDLEKQVEEAKYKGDATNKKIEELEPRNILLGEQIQEAKEKQVEITPFWNLASMLQKEINQVLLSLAGEMYRVKQIQDKLKELEFNSTQFWRMLLDVVGLVKNQLAWIETHSTFPANMPQKSAGSLKM